MCKIFSIHYLFKAEHEQIKFLQQSNSNAYIFGALISFHGKLILLILKKDSNQGKRYLPSYKRCL